jgi:hypothetical protein
VFSARMLSAREVVGRDQSPATAVSPILGKLYVRLGSGGGEKLFPPGEPIPLRGIGFHPAHRSKSWSTTLSWRRLLWAETELSPPRGLT